MPALPLAHRRAPRGLVDLVDLEEVARLHPSVRAAPWPVFLAPPDRGAVTVSAAALLLGVSGPELLRALRQQRIADATAGGPWR